MATTNTFSQQLLDLLATRNFHPEMLDSQGQPSDAEDAKTFSFDYVSGAGKNYGTMVIVLDNDNEMKIMYGDNLGRTMEGDDKSEFFDFLQHLNKKATMNRWTHTIADISQLKRTMQGLAAIKEGLFEGYYGNRNISYTGQPTEARLRIVHSQPLGESDARYRHIAKLFIETAEGEVFKLGFRNLSGGKAMLEHVRQGGKPYDIRGCHITEMVNEIATLGRFNRASANRVLEGVTQELVTEAQAYYTSLRENLRRMATGRGYSAYFESWHPADISEQEELVENIKTMFIEQTLDTRIEAALPLLARIQQQGKAMKEADIFENWVNNLGEGTWALPETLEQQAKLKELMSQPLLAGADGTDATEQLYDLVGDDVLFDIIDELAEKNPDANVWDDEGVQRRLEELGIYVVDSNDEAPAPDAAVAPAPAEEPPVAPVAEQINAMRRAAGLPVVEGVLNDDTGNTWDHLVDRFRHEVQQFKQGGELDHDLYDALFDYYSQHGAMPYGVAKARTGDPFAWVSHRFADDLGMAEGDNLSTFEVMSGFDAPTVEAQCNMTHEGEYCPEHGLAECGTTAGGMAPVVMGEESMEEGVVDWAKEKYHDYQTGRQWSKFDKAQRKGDQAGMQAAQDAAAAHRDQLQATRLKRTGSTLAKNSDYGMDQDRANIAALQKKGLVPKNYGSIAEAGQEAFVNKHHDDPINSNSAMTGSYYESKEGDALLARIKSLALLK